MVPPPQALLTSLVANAVCVCGNQGAAKSLKGETEEGKDKDRTLEVGGVEVIVNDLGAHAHTVYPHFDDRPSASGLPAHCCCASHEFGIEPGGVINDIRHAGVEIITSNGADLRSPHAVYPHFGDRPDNGHHAHTSYPAFGINPDGLIGASDGSSCHVVYPHYGDRPDDGHHAHTMYPTFGTSSDGLIGEKVKENDAIRHRPHVVYPSFGDRPENGNRNHAHVSYPVFGIDPDGLIGERAKDDAVVSHDGIEIIASNGSDSARPHAVYLHPDSGDWPDEAHSNAHAVYPIFGGGNFGGLIGEKIEGDVKFESGVEVIVDDSLKSFPISVYPSFDLGPEGLIGEKELVEAIDVTGAHAISEKKVIDAVKLTGADAIASDGVASGTTDGELKASIADMVNEIEPGGSSSLSKLEDEEWVAKLVAAFLALPRAHLLLAMMTATQKVGLKPGPRTEPCTVCRAQDEQRNLESTVAYMPCPIAAT